MTIKKSGKILIISLMILLVSNCKTIEPISTFTPPQDVCDRPEFFGCPKTSQEIMFYQKIQALNKCLRETEEYIELLRGYANCKEDREQMLLKMLKSK